MHESNAKHPSTGLTLITKRATLSMGSDVFMSAILFEIVLRFIRNAFDFTSRVDAADFYMAVAVVSTVLYGLKLVMLAHADFDSIDGDTPDDSSFTFFSLQSILAFFMGFGWSGSACFTKLRDVSPVVVFFISVLAGSALLFLSVWTMSLVKKLNCIPKVDLSNAIGHVGTAYIRMAPGGMGKIRMELNGKISIFNAKNVTNQEIKAFDAVKVIAVNDRMFNVEKV
ncbi:MAG: hypothetical protein LBJ89_01655 [Holosporales bacterium]|jgi:hypothetical protein|nr:hypothetical protein [Holosporales bacterium]